VVFRRAVRLDLRAPGQWLGRFLWKKGDGWLIDGFGPDGIAARVQVTNRVVKLQTGFSITMPSPC
jgi:hypothetical protein